MACTHLIFARGSQKILLTAVAVLTLGGCTQLDCDKADLQRTLGPSGQHEVLVQTRNCGATMALEYRIFIVPAAGMKAANTSAAIMMATSVDDLEVTWVSASLLQIEYKKARIWEFRNFWHEIEADGTARQIDIIERKK